MMPYGKSRFFARSFVVGLIALVSVLANHPGRLFAWQGANRFSGPTKSGTLALSADDALLAVANPDNNSVTLFDVQNDNNQKLVEVPVGKEPNGVVVSPDGSTVYVANTVDGTVSVLQVDRAASPIVKITATLKVGTEPYGVAITPNGTKVYVTNARSNSVSVIDTATNTVVKTITNIGPSVGSEPRGIAITNNGNENDGDETIYITHFYAFPTAKLDGEDDAKTALVTRISVNTDSVGGQVVLKNLVDTGFKATGDAIAKQESKEKLPDGKLKPTFTTGAYPNQLQAIAIKGGFAYLPNVGASPNGPVAFNVNTHSLVHVLNIATNQDAAKPVNLHKAVATQPEGTRKLFPTVPWAIAFKGKENFGYVVSAASNVVVKIGVDDAGTVTPVINPIDKRVQDISVGRHPTGIVINSTDTRAYVANQISRDVTIIDLTRNPEQVSGTMRAAPLPAAGSPQELELAGKELYHTSVGEFENGFGNMSSEGWGSCGSCHPFGLADNVVWIFGAGPRRTISQHQDFIGGFQRTLNWSGIFDEQHDFDLNIRGTSGGKGLLLKQDGSGLEETAKIGGLVIGNPAALAINNSTRPQLKFRTQSGSLVNAWDAIVAYEKVIRAPISPLADSTDPEIAEGRQIFIQNNCQSCHGGAKWSSSRIDKPITDLKLLKTGQIVGELRNVGTFNPADKNEVRANGQPPLGADGFVPPSLIGVFMVSPYYHNGSATSLEDAMGDRFITHRSAGTGGIDGLTNPDDRRKLIKFLQSIDGTTEPIAP
jgi:YVTN family beta-propeller protein